MEFPLAERELRRLAQRPMTFATRAALAVIAAPILSFFFLADAASGGTAAQADEIAATLSFLGNMYLFIVSVLVPPFLTAGLIASEKHERTLGTLLIADFSASDVALSKFVPTLIQVELLVLGSLPILAFATVLGGITPSDLVLSVFLFSMTALVVSSVGLFASTVARQPGGALMGTVVVLAPVMALDLGLLDWLGVPGLPDLPTLLPAVAVFAIDELTGADLWLPSVGISAAVSLVLILASIALLPRQVYAMKVARPGRFRALRRPVNPFLRERGTSLIFSRAAGGLSAAVRSTILKIVFGIALALIALIPCVGLLFVAGVVMFDVVSTMDNAKRSGVLDDIRLSAPDPKTFLWDIYYALWMRGWFYLPAIVVGGSIGFSGWMLSIIAGPGMVSDAPFSSVVFVVVVLVVSLVIGSAQLALMTAIACYQSGYGRNIRSQTLTSVLLYVVVCLVTYFGLAMAGVMIEAVRSSTGGDLASAVVVTVLVSGGLTGVLALWTLGFYSSYRTRHLRYV